MKQLFAILSFLIFFSISNHAFAIDPCLSVYGDFSVPRTINGTTFNDVVSWKAGPNDFYITIFYNYDPLTYPHALKVNYYGQLGHKGYQMYRYTNWGSGDYCYEDSAFQDSPGTGWSWGYFYNSYPPLDTQEIHSTQPIYSIDDSAIDVDANLGDPGPQLVITMDPLDGGNIEVDNVSCTTCPCVYDLSEVDESSIQATANTGYAFGYWKEITNPYPITPTGNKTMTAMFFKTFRNAVGDFYADIEDIGGECVDYVDYETNITNASGQPFSGDAWTYYQQAIDAGYQTGSVPRVGAIVVFNRSALLEYGHVGIVTAIGESTITIRDSNWCTPYCYLVDEHSVDVSNHTVHYIYRDPQ